MKERDQVRIQHENLTIRQAEAADAKQLAAWWNDGAVMAHAGFPNGLGTTEEEVVKRPSDWRVQLPQCVRWSGRDRY